ncbi:hypothetical protein QM012_004037 [Aureobasidium pullulans]|uniref:Uncharacterized protein n=1 Tax=Aureobasidium pullulans TaxID=5580 RepID=A0ABR0T6H5_AURPU
MAPAFHDADGAVLLIIAALFIMASAIYVLDSHYPRRGQGLRRHGRALLGEAKEGQLLPLFWPNGNRDFVFEMHHSVIW